MGLWITLAVALAVVAVLGWRLRRRGDTANTWDGRPPGQQKRRDTGEFGGEHKRNLPHA